MPLHDCPSGIKFLNPAGEPPSVLHFRVGVETLHYDTVINLPRDGYGLHRMAIVAAIEPGRDKIPFKPAFAERQNVNPVLDKRPGRVSQVVNAVEGNSSR